MVVRRLFGLIVLDCRSPGSKELEILVLRHELSILRRHAKRPQLQEADRVFLAALSRRNSKFRGAFDEVFRSDGVTIIRTPVRARTQTRTPSAGSVTVRRECLDRILIINRRHLENVLRAYTARASAYSST